MFRAIVFPDARQQILEVTEYEIETHDLRDRDEEQKQARIQEQRQMMSHHVFKTDEWPLFQFKIFRMTETVNYVFFSIDHLIADAGSLRIFARELMQLCNAPAMELPKLDFSYRDYVLAYEKLKNSDRFKTIKNYWFSTWNYKR